VEALLFSRSEPLGRGRACIGERQAVPPADGASADGNDCTSYKRPYPANTFQDRAHDDGDNRRKPPFQKRMASMPSAVRPAADIYTLSMMTPHASLN